jgi:hypothetical protein
MQSRVSTLDILTHTHTTVATGHTIMRRDWVAVPRGLGRRA